ncbi:MAG: AMP-binding protein [Microthrixaceae bacterium]
MEFNIAQVHEAVERAVPDRECIVFRQRRLTYRDVGDRSRQIANALLDAGLGKSVPRSQLAPGTRAVRTTWRSVSTTATSTWSACSGRSRHGSCRSTSTTATSPRSSPTCCAHVDARGIVYHSAFAPVLGEVLDAVPGTGVRWQVPDDSGIGLLEGSRWYDDALAGQPTVLAEGTAESWSPDDLYLLYTGGTTGMPKGVMWRQADIFVAALGGRRLDNDREAGTRSTRSWRTPVWEERACSPWPPSCTGPRTGLAFNGFTNANTVLLSDVVDHLDPLDVVRVIERESVEVLLIVGDAFGRPIVEVLERGAYDVDSLLIVVNGGAALSPGIKERLLARIPTAIVADGLGSSETGQQASQLSTAGRRATTGTFRPYPDVRVLDEDLAVGPGAGTRRDRLAGPDRPCSAGLPRRPRQVPDGPSPPSTAPGTRSLATGHVCTKTGTWSWSVGRRPRSTRAARRSSPRRSNRRSCTTAAWWTAWSPDARRHAGAKRS